MIDLCLSVVDLSKTYSTYSSLFFEFRNVCKCHLKTEGISVVRSSSSGRQSAHMSSHVFSPFLLDTIYLYNDTHFSFFVLFLLTVCFRSDQSFISLAVGDALVTSCHLFIPTVNRLPLCICLLHHCPHLLLRRRKNFLSISHQKRLRRLRYRPLRTQ